MGGVMYDKRLKKSNEDTDVISIHNWNCWKINLPYFVRNQTLSSAFWARERNNLPAEQNIFTNELISGGECDRVVRAFEYRTRKSTFAAIHSSYFLNYFCSLNVTLSFMFLMMTLYVSGLVLLQYVRKGCTCEQQGGLLKTFSFLNMKQKFRLLSVQGL